MPYCEHGFMVGIVPDAGRCPRCPSGPARGQRAHSQYSWTEQDLEQLRRLLQERKSYREISLLLNRSMAAIRNAVCRHGLA